MQAQPSQRLAPPAAGGPKPASSALSKRRKAAVIVQMLLADGQKLSLASLPEDVQLNLTRELANLRIIDVATMKQVAKEFALDLESVGIAVPGGVEAALTRLADQISPATAARIRSELGEAEDNPWAQIVAMELDDLVPVMQEESVEVAAVVLSKLPVARAATLLGKLPGELARRITLAVSQTEQIRPDAVQRIGTAIARTHCARPVPVFAEPPGKRVGEILNSSLASTRDSVLEGLSSDDPNFAETVRKAIFTFEDIPARVAVVDAPKVIRAVDEAVLVTALTAALAAGDRAAETAEFILGNISQRMADGLREQISERGKIKKSAGEEAMGDIVRAVKEAVDAGDFALIETDAEEDDDD